MSLGGLSRMERQALAGFAVIVVVMAVLHEVMQLKELGGVIQAQLLEDYYSTLNVRDVATKQEIETAYKRAMNKIMLKPQDTDSRLQRTKVFAAHEALANPEVRRKYDQRRRLVRIASIILTGACAVVPLVVLLVFGYRATGGMRCPWRRGLDPSSFEGKLASALDRIEGSVQVNLQKTSPNESLGMQLTPTRRGAALHITGVASGGLVERHNRELTAQPHLPGGVRAWWQEPSLQIDDMVTCVNGTSGHEGMMSELRSSSSISLTLRRPVRDPWLPWIAEVEPRRCQPGEKWGCQLKDPSDDSDTLEVGAVEDASPMGRWNRANPELKVQLGDRLVAVGRTLGSQGMLAQLKNTDVLTTSWVVVRGARHETSRPAEIVCGPFDKMGDRKLGIRIGALLESPVRGAVVERGDEAAMIVKDVVKGFLVDNWNQQGKGPQVLTGSIVISVNGCSDTKTFALELQKPSVTLRLRPPRGSDVNVVQTAQPQADEKKEPWARRLFGEYAPSFLLPKSFEARLRASLATLRAEFSVEIIRGTSDQRMGMQLEPARDEVGGLKVTELVPGGLVGQHCTAAADAAAADGRRRPPAVRKGDRLVAVNEITTGGLMIEALGNASLDKLQLRFSRSGAEAAPGVWEAEVVRWQGETWGIELQDDKPTAGPRGPGALKIESVTPGLAIDRWNEKAKAANQWPIEPGDLIVACKPAVGHAETLEQLKASRRTKLTLLRWHTGPAPAGTVDVDGKDKSEGHIFKFDVTVERKSTGDRLGVRLDPSERDPTRTAVSEVISGGLVDLHNRAVLAASSAAGVDTNSLPVVHKGDELQAINGESDPAQFPACCVAQRVVLSLVRRSTQQEASPVSHMDPQTHAAAALTQAPSKAPVAAMAHREMSPPVAKAVDKPPVAAKEMIPPPMAAKEMIPPPMAAKGMIPPPMAAKEMIRPPMAAAAAAAAAVKPEVQHVATPPSQQHAARLVQQVAPPSPQQRATSNGKECQSPAVVAVATTPTAGSPSANSAQQAEIARENFLLKAEVEQLRNRLRAEPAVAEELQAARAERDALRAENETLRAESAKMQRGSVATRRAVAEAETLRTEAADLRARARGLEEQLGRSEEASARLRAENSKLRTRLSQAEELPALGGLDEGVARLQELAVSLEHVLAGDQRSGIAG